VRIAVTTPTGNIGSKLSNILLDRGADIVVIARHPEKVKGLTARGAKVVAGEHDDASVLEHALHETDALFWVSPPNYATRDPLGDTRRFADVAASAVKKYPTLRVVQLSSVGAHLPSGTGPIAGLHYAENQFRSVATNFVALRPNYFMENIFSYIPTIISDGNMYTSNTGSITTPQIATQDISEVAADVLLSGMKGQKVVDIAGPEDISFDYCAEVIGRELGKQVRVLTIPGEQLKLAFVEAGLSSQVADLLVEMQGSFERGMPHELVGDEKRVGKMSYPQFVREVVVPAAKNAMVRA
jgi:uncharacterized protein YbjT (DUF2867 family)